MYILPSILFSYFFIHIHTMYSYLCHVRSSIIFLSSIKRRNADNFWFSKNLRFLFFVFFSFCFFHFFFFLIINNLDDPFFNILMTEIILLVGSYYHDFKETDVHCVPNEACYSLIPTKCCDNC